MCPVNKKKRIHWAKTHQHWRAGDWERVIYGWIKVWKLGSKCHQFEHCLPHERLNPQCVIPTAKHGEGSVMVWGSFGGNKVWDLVKVDGKMNQKVYHGLLQQHSKTSGLRLIGKGFVLQQDNNPKHTSCLWKNFVKSLEDKKMLKNMEWPPQSPDCNPIELLWDELDRKI